MVFILLYGYLITIFPNPTNIFCNHRTNAKGYSSVKYHLYQRATILRHKVCILRNTHHGNFYPLHPISPFILRLTIEKAF